MLKEVEKERKKKERKRNKKERGKKRRKYEFYVWKMGSIFFSDSFTHSNTLHLRDFIDF